MIPDAVLETTTILTIIENYGSLERQNSTIKMERRMKKKQEWINREE